MIGSRFDRCRGLRGVQDEAMSNRVAAVAGVAAVSAVVVAWLFLVYLPGWLVGLLPEAPSLTAQERAQATADARVACLQFLAGTVVGTGLLFTAIQIRQRRVEQSAELFLNAIEKLADDRTEAQLYGIYGLDRVADLSEADRRAVERILAQYVRQRVRIWTAEHDPESRGDMRGKGSAQRLSDPAFQAALEAFGRPRHGRRRAALDMEGLRLEQPHLDGLNFERTCLRNAELADGHFNGTSFRESSLRSARVEGELRGADFRGADLRGATIVTMKEFQIGIRFEGAFYNVATTVEPEELAQQLRRSGTENRDAWPLIEGCR